MAVHSVPNEVGLRGAMLATESIRGQFVAPTQRIMVPFTAMPGIGSIKRSQDATGGYDKTASVRREFKDPEGTFGGTATYQELAIFSQYAVKGGVTGSSDANPYVATTYPFAPSFHQDDIDSFSVLFNHEGLPMEAMGVRFDEFNISGDATGGDNEWQIGGTPFLTHAGRFEGFEGVATSATTTKITMSGASWTVNEHQGAYVFLNYGSGNGEVRVVASNTATELTLADALPAPPPANVRFYISGIFPSLPQPQFDVIEMEGTKVFLDVYNPSASTVGTTDVSERVLSFNVTQTLNLANKRRAPGVIGKIGRGDRVISGNVRFEFDRWDEWVKWHDNTQLSLRIEKVGPAINVSPNTFHRARIDIERFAFDDFTIDEDGNNITATVGFVALAETPVWSVNVVTNIASLP